MPSNKKALALLAGAVMTIAAPFTAREEGLKTYTYLDSVGVPTACYGETDGVRKGDKFTEEDCDTLFYLKLGIISTMVDLAVTPDMPAQMHAALTSWTYNVGVSAMRSSTLIKRANAGDFRGACDELLKWKWAGGKPILLPRRERERALCLSGL